MRRYIKLSLIVVLLFLLFLFSFQKPISQDQAEDRDYSRWTRLQNFVPITPASIDESYVTYEVLNTLLYTPGTDESDIIDLLNWGSPGYKRVRIDTANELYDFSVDVSFHNTSLSSSVIDLLLDLHYVLGNDIDYSVMQSRQFVPIGYNFVFTNPSSIDTQKSFTGVFDGRGFEIQNLYVAGYESLHTTEEIDFVEEDVAITSYYAMFNYNEGEIRNLGLVNPTFELLDINLDITKAANLVGENSGIIDHVYVIDTRPNELQAGIRMRAPTGATTVNYQASGMVFFNTIVGEFSNAYYVSPTVVNGSYASAFEVQPVLFINENSNGISNLVYDGAADGGASGVYKRILNVGGTTFEVTTPNAYAINEETAVLRSNSASGDWFYYPQDRYPTLLGLDYDAIEDVYLINNSIDLVTFSKLITYNSVLHGTPFREATFHIIDDIDMSQVARDAYVTPDIAFSGEFRGVKSSGQYSINHFSPKYVVDSENYYVGLFSTLSGTVTDITFKNATITLQNSDPYFGRTFFMGTVAGLLDGGMITDVNVLLDMDYGTETVGTLYAGAIVGRASGVINTVYAQGNIGTSTPNQFDPTLDVLAQYQIGGIVGGSGLEPLFFYNALNTATIHTISSDANISSTGNPFVYVGGVIGRVSNTSQYKHNLGLLTNEGTIYSQQLHSASTVTQYIGGVIGLSEGNTYDINYDFGVFTNKANLDFTNRGSNIVHSGGVLVANHLETTEFIHLYNTSTATISTSGYTGLNYTTLIYNVGTGGIIVSQAENNADLTITGNTSISGVYHSVNNAQSLLRFVKNTGNITYQNQTFTAEVVVSGFSRSLNIDYLNVYYEGTISLRSITSNNQIWVAGITRFLSSNRYMRNALNEGEIFVAGINNSLNTYVGGLVNINLAGNLDPNGNAEYPSGTQGIYNSINYANILSYFDESNNRFTGLGNAFVGGIATFNHGSIQNVANVGDIRIDNNAATNTSVVTFSTDNTIASRVLQFRHGVIIGGVTAAVLSQDSRIYDSANSGEIIAKSRNFARAGGILGSALMEELFVSGSDVSLVTAARLGFSWNTNTSQNDIKESIISNSINYGNISSVTQRIILYSTTSITGRASSWFVSEIPIKMSSYYPNSVALYMRNANNTGDLGLYYTTTEGTQERIGVVGSAGGVIGYGLSTMRRMFNHGEVSSTDVAGGIVGATFVAPTYNVKIDTAVNYGSVRMVNHNNYNSIASDSNYDSIRSIFRSTTDPFITPNDTYVRFFPGTKRGIGGIFGRLQRGLSQVMGTEGGIFNFIVNLDPNVDLIGRLDQVYKFSSSTRFFRFGTDSNYYSANPNDRTQAVFTGFEFFGNGSQTVNSISSSVLEISKQRYRYYSSGGNFYSIKQELVEQKTELSYTGTKYTVIGDASTSTTTLNQRQVFRSTVNSSSWQDIPGTVEPLSQNPGLTFSDAWNVEPDRTVTDNSTLGLTSGRRYMVDARPVPFISENENDYYFIYAETFDMRADQNLQEFVFYVENEVLSDTFRDDRPYGMYVLATSSGSSVGSVIPANLSLSSLFPLDGEQPFDHDYSSSINRIPLSNQDVIDKYYALLQTRYNDKAALLEVGQDLRLEEVDGFGNKLLSPNYNNFNGKITFDLHLDKVATSAAPLQFQVTNALLPTNALIAARISDYFGSDPIDYNLFRGVLENDAGMHISINAPPLLEINLNPFLGISSAQTVTLGYIVSYSEASIFIDGFMMEPYIAEYEIELNLIPKQSVQNNPYPYQYFLDGGTGASFSFTNNESTIAAPFNSSIRLTFRDQGNVLPVGTDITQFVTLEYDGQVVNPIHYTITPELAVGGTFNQFGFGITLSNQMRGGEYTVRMKYFSVDQEKTITIHKAKSQNLAITNLVYNSSGAFTAPVGNTFTTFINFGYTIDTDNVYFTPVVDSNPSIPSYLSNTTYEISYLTSFAISPFAELTDVSYIGMDYVDGYRRLRFEYTIEAENENPTTYIHYIQERAMSVTNVFRNNNKVNVNNIFATREAVQTNFAIDFGVHASVAQEVYNTLQENPDAYFSVSVTGETLDAIPIAYAPEDIVGISYTTDRYFNIIMSNQTKSGKYYFTFTYHRDGQTISFGVSHTLVITKQLGVDAYLTNIQFSESAQETEYPLIAVSDANGQINPASPYDPRVFFGGIDYSGAKGQAFHFRIDGKVSSTPLNEYFPFFLDFLPAGAKISRKVYPIEGPQEWTVEVDKDSPLGDIALLATDFTLMPDTLFEPDEDLGEEVIITYRVRSENLAQTVYYHITVTDVDFNVSLIFEFVYDHPTLGRIMISESELANKPILINVKNVLTNVNTTQTPAPTVPEFPLFQTITDVRNSINMFYVGSDSTYRYRFGRNLSGFYIFEVSLPRDTVGNRYGYMIEYSGLAGDEYLNNVSSVHPSFEQVNGKYFYIHGSTRNRTRYFTVVISPATPFTDDSWGLYDYYETWR